MVSVSWESILKAKPSWAGKTDLKDLTPEEVTDLKRIKDNREKATKEEKYYYNQLLGLRHKVAEDRRKKKEQDAARAEKKPAWKPEKLPEAKPDEIDYSKKRKGYITLEDFIKHNLKKHKGESIFAKANPLRFDLVKDKLILMRGDKDKSISNQKFAEVINWYIIPENYKDVNDMRHFKIDDNFQMLIGKLGKEKLGFLYYIFTGTSAPEEKKLTPIEEKRKSQQTEYLDLIEDVFGHTKHAQYNYGTFKKKLDVLDNTYKLFLNNVPENEWSPEQQTIAKNILKNKRLLMVVKDTEKYIINNRSYKLEKGENRAVNDFRQFYNLVKYFLVKKNTTIEQMLDDLIEGKEEQVRISDSLRNKWKEEEKRLKLLLSNYNLTERQENKLITVINEVGDAIFKNNDEKDEYVLTKEEVERIIKDNIDNLKGEDLSSDFIKGVKGQLYKLIGALKNVEGIDNLKTIVDSFELSSRNFTYDVKKALNPKLASLPEEPVKRLKKTLQAAEPSEYFGQDYTRLGELIDLLQEMDFTKEDSELDEKIKSISEQNIDMVATAARLRKTYETLYLQVRKIVYPKASEGSLREEEEV